jgi:hypothetical protein
VPTQVCPPIIAGAIQIALELLYGAGIGPERQVAE